MVRFITHYNSQYHAIKMVLRKLTTDPAISKYVTPQPSIVFRCASSSKDKLVHSHYTGHRLTIRNLPRGTFGNCVYSQFINTRKNMVKW